MRHSPTTLSTPSRLATAIGIVLASPLLFLAPPASAQEYVGRYSVYAGYMFLNTPRLNLFQPGYHFEAGMRVSRRLSVGLDYSRGRGDTALTPDLATTELQQQLSSYIDPLKAAGVLPADYVPVLPLNSLTQTFTAGPQFPYRRFNRVTLFIRPAIGLIYEKATGYPTDFITRVLMAQIAPSGKKNDRTMFYGVGGGMALNFSKHFSLLVQADYVHDHLFDDLLKDGRRTLRFSVGPGFQFGKNVPRPQPRSR